MMGVPSLLLVMHTPKPGWCSKLSGCGICRPFCWAVFVMAFAKGCSEHFSVSAANCRIWFGVYFG